MTKIKTNEVKLGGGRFGRGPKGYSGCIFKLATPSVCEHSQPQALHFTTLTSGKLYSYVFREQSELPKQVVSSFKGCGCLYVYLNISSKRTFACITSMKTPHHTAGKPFKRVQIKTDLVKKCEH